MSFEGWYFLLGGVMLLVVFSDIFLRRIAITAAIIYLLLGFVLGPLVLGKINIDPLQYSPLLERITEVAVIVSLFTAGLKLEPNLRSKAWVLPLRLAFLSMCVTVGLIALVGVFLLNLSPGAAILLGAILAPTDPVLASDVQLNHPEDKDRVRFSLTGEAAFNDGTAFPFVMLGLGLLGLHEIGQYGWKWLAVDVLWAIVGGLAIGALQGTLIGRLIVWVRHMRKETLERDEFIAIGLICLSYGSAILIHTYGFLAVFAAALFMRREEARGYERHCQKNGKNKEDKEKEEEEKQVYSVLRINEQLERMIELGLVLVVSGMLSLRFVASEVAWFAPLLFFIIRPMAVLLFARQADATKCQRALISWFGIRGIGSLYYLFYAIEHGVPEDTASKLVSLVLCVLAISVVVHGISVTPFMEFYKKLRSNPAGS